MAVCYGCGVWTLKLNLFRIVVAVWTCGLTLLLIVVYFSTCVDNATLLLPTVLALGLNGGVCIIPFFLQNWQLKCVIVGSFPLFCIIDSSNVHENEKIISNVNLEQKMNTFNGWWIQTSGHLDSDIGHPGPGMVQMSKLNFKQGSGISFLSVVWFVRTQNDSDLDFCQPYFKRIQVSPIMRTRILLLYACKFTYQTHDHTYILINKSTTYIT